VIPGSLANYWAARFVTTLVYGLDARGSSTFGLAILVLTTAALIAGWLPARRASRLDPLSVLREI
jgi:ABC-type antimicrobial peptide transport system permease subunit